MSTELTFEMVRRIGGYPSGSRVLAVADFGDTAVAVTDPNGDGNYHDLQYFDLSGGQWETGGGSSGAISQVFGVHGSGVSTPKGRPGVRYVFGRCEHPGPQRITIDVRAGTAGRPDEHSWKARELDVTASEEGWWLWAERIPTAD